MTINNAVISYAPPTHSPYLNPIANALQALRQRYLDQQAEDLSLDREVEKYIRQKDFDAAADLFGEAVRLAPWWSDGFYNSGSPS